MFNTFSGLIKGRPPYPGTTFIPLLVWPFTVTMVWPWAWNPFDPFQYLLLLVGAVAAGFMSLVRSDPDDTRKPAWICFLPGLPLLILATRITATAQSGWPLALGVGFWSALFIAATIPSLMHGRTQKLLLRCWLGIGLIQATLIIFQALGVDPLVLFTGKHPRPWRIYGTLGNPNLAASLLVPLILLATDELLLQRRLIRRLVISIMTIGVITTGSRFAIILLAGLMLWRYADTGKTDLKKIFFLLIMLTAATALSFFVAYLMGKGMDSPVGRLHFWRTAVFLSLNGPWNGLGWMSFGSAYPTGLAPGAPNSIPEALPLHAHNDWLEFGVEFGPGGWIIPILIIYFLACKTGASASRPLVISLWSIVLLGSWSSPLHQASIGLLFWMLAGCCARGHLSNKQTSSFPWTGYIAVPLTLCLLSLPSAYSRLQGHILAARANTALARPDDELWAQSFYQAPMEGYFALRLAINYARNGRLGESFAWSSRAATVTPDFNAWKVHAWSLGAMGCFNESLTFLEQVRTYFPGVRSISELEQDIKQARTGNDVVEDERNCPDAQVWIGRRESYREITN